MYFDSCSLCKKLLWRRAALCESCNVRLSVAPFLYRKVGYLDVCSLFHYVTSAAPLIFACKNGATPELSRRLGSLLAQKLLDHSYCEFQAVVPIPASEKGAKDHAWILAEAVAQELKIPILGTLLERTPLLKLNSNDRRTRSQKNQSRVGRAAVRLGLADHVNSVSFDETKGSLIIVDDVLTTGATLARAARLLSNPMAIGLTLASRPKFRDPEPASDRAFEEDDCIE